MTAGITRNTMYNLAGGILPAAVSLLTIPIYIGLIGESRYGALIIVWLILGYFNFFDLGLNQGTARWIAKFRVTVPSNVAIAFWTSLYINSALGLVGGILLYTVLAPIIDVAFSIPAELKVEIRHSVPWIAAAVPMATISGVFSGALMGFERFSLLNIIQVCASVASQLLPLTAASIWGASLEIVVPAAVAARAISALAMGVAAFILTRVRRPVPPTRVARELIGYGGWVTVDNALGHLLANVDQLLIGALLGTKAVAYYAVPCNLAKRLLMIPGALSSALFPRFAALDRAQCEGLALRAAETLCIVTTLLCGTAVLLAKPFFDTWLGLDFSSRAAPIAEIALAGIWITGITYIPFTMLQAQGRPELITKSHLIQLPPFLMLLWFATEYFGLLGVVVLWTARVFCDAFILFWLSGMLRKLVILLIPPGTLLIALVAVVLFKDLPLLARVLLCASVVAATLLWASATHPRAVATLWRWTRIKAT